MSLKPHDRSETIYDCLEVIIIKTLTHILSVLFSVPMRWALRSFHFKNIYQQRHSNGGCFIIG